MGVGRQVARSTSRKECLLPLYMDESIDPIHLIEVREVLSIDTHTQAHRTAPTDRPLSSNLPLLRFIVSPPHTQRNDELHIRRSPGSRESGVAPGKSLRRHPPNLVSIHIATTTPPPFHRIPASPSSAGTPTSPPGDPNPSSNPLPRLRRYDSPTGVLA